MSKNLTNEEKDFLTKSIRNIPDFPKAGIQFKDITTLLNNAKAFKMLLDHLVARYKDMNLDFIAGIESRGFIFGAPLAALLGIGFVPIRKPGKLPAKVITESYTLEYGEDTIEIHEDAFFLPNKATNRPRVLLIDDLIATGGTAEAAVKLIEKANGECVEACFLVELTELKGTEPLKPLTNVYSILTYDI